MEKFLIDYVKKNKKYSLAKSNSSSKKPRKNNFMNSESKINQKKIKKNLHQRNILFNQKTSIKNINSTSTSSLSSSTEKKYLTPTKYNKENNFENDYYFNESFNNKLDLFKNMNISRPKLDYNSNNKKIKSLHLALGAGIDRYSTIYFSSNDYRNKDLIVNRSLKFHKNKLVLCRKVNISRNNSRNNEKEQDLSSKSVENCNNNKKLSDIIQNFTSEQTEKNEFTNPNNRYNILIEKNKRKENSNDINCYSNIKEKKFKNIVLRPPKIKNEKQFNFQEISLKHNIEINKYKKEENPELIKNILQDFHKKPKHSSVFKYK